MPAQCYVYVDAAYVQKHLSDQGLSAEFDPTKPAAFVRNESVGGERLLPSRVFYYDAVDEQAAEPERSRRKAYLDQVERLADTHVVTGFLSRGRRRQQKGVDVRLAVDAMEAAFLGRVPVIALVTGDADFAPLAEAIRRAGPHVLVLAFKQSLSPDLAAAADRVRELPDQPSDWNLTTAG